MFRWDTPTKTHSICSKLQDKWVNSLETNDFKKIKNHLLKKQITENVSFKPWKTSSLYGKGVILVVNNECVGILIKNKSK